MNTLTLINTIGLIALGVYVMVTKTEFVASLDEHTEQLKKVQTEQETTKARVAELEAVIAAGGDTVDPAIVDAWGRLKDQIQKNDDVIQDLQVPTP